MTRWFPTLVVVLLAPSSCGENKEFVPAGSNLWTGVTVYTRDKAFAFRVLGGNDSHVFPNGMTARGIKVILPDGSTTWRNRDSIAKTEEHWLVKSDDPALSIQQWDVINE